MATIKGRLVYVAIDEQIIECLMTSSLNVTASKVVESTQCGGGFEESSPSTIEWNVQVEGKLDPAKTYNGEDVMAAILAGTVFDVYWGEATIGKTFYHGSGYFSNVVFNANHSSDEKVGFTATIQGTGILESDTVVVSTLV
jgi:hypothetical protein